MRKVTTTTRVANAVINLSGRGWMKFNDKMKDGRRSLKVFGWTDEDYKNAERILTAMGCKVEKVSVNSYNFRAGSSFAQTRLHVKEPA